MCRDRLLLSPSLSLSLSLSLSVSLSGSLSVSLSLSLSLSLSVCLSLSLSLSLSLCLSLSLFTDSLSHSLQTLSSSLSLSLPFVPFIFPVTQNAPELGIFPAPRPQNPVFPRWDTPKKPKRQNGGTFCCRFFFAIFTYCFPVFLRFLGKKGASLRGRCHIYIYIYMATPSFKCGNFGQIREPN